MRERASLRARAPSLERLRPRARGMCAFTHTPPLLIHFRLRHGQPGSASAASRVRISDSVGGAYAFTGAVAVMRYSQSLSLSDAVATAARVSAIFEQRRGLGGKEEQREAGLGLCVCGGGVGCVCVRACARACVRVRACGMRRRGRGEDEKETRRRRSTQAH